MTKVYLQYTLLLLIPNFYYFPNPSNILFTIHFATINTEKCYEEIKKYLEFTIHFATINTINLLH